MPWEDASHSLLSSASRINEWLSAMGRSVLKALAELGLSVPGSAEPQLGVGRGDERGEPRTFISDLADE